MGVGDAPEWKKTKMLRHKGGLDRRLPVTMAPTLVYRIGPFLKAQMVRQYQAAEKAINAPLLFVIALSLTFLVLPREQLQVPGRMQLRLYYVVRTQELHNTLIVVVIVILSVLVLLVIVLIVAVFSVRLHVPPVGAVVVDHLFLSLFLLAISIAIPGTNNNFEQSRNDALFAANLIGIHKIAAPGREHAASSIVACHSRGTTSC